MPADHSDDRRIRPKTVVFERFNFTILRKALVEITADYLHGHDSTGNEEKPCKLTRKIPVSIPCYVPNQKNATASFILFYSIDFEKPIAYRVKREK